MKTLSIIILFMATIGFSFGMAVSDTTLNNGANNPKFKIENPHASRYFFAPSAINLKKGEGYYQNTYLFLNSVNFGITDNISLGGGMVFPPSKYLQIFYFTPKISLPIKKNWRVSTGAFATMVRTSSFLETDRDKNTIYAGILFANTTVGDENKNLTLGLGYAYGDKEFKKTPIFNLNALWRVSNKIVLITENHFFNTDDNENTKLGILSGGVRVLGDKIAVDLGLVRPISNIEDDFGIEYFAFPYIDVTLKWNRKKKK